MTSTEKKQQLRAWKARQREAARAAVPLPDQEMKALFDQLDASLPTMGCDHTRRLTDAWLRERRHPLEGVHAWLDNNGGFCDCEVLANSEQAWIETIDKGAPFVLEADDNPNERMPK